MLHVISSYVKSIDEYELFYEIFLRDGTHFTFNKSQLRSWKNPFGSNLPNKGQYVTVVLTESNQCVLNDF